VSRLRRSIALLACLLCAAALLTASRAAGEGPDRPDQPHPPQMLRVNLLQMNLCNSGIASCYTGRSVAAAAEVIRDQEPDVVTLNEVCEEDIEVLRTALVAAHPGEPVVSAFEPAYDRRTASDFQCTNGQRYGVGLLVRVPEPYRGHTTYGGLYPDQDPVDPEERAWLCVGAVAAFYACTTHLAYTSDRLALAQCRHLLGTAIPAAYEADGYLPTVVAGDLNLAADGGASDVRSCLPAGYGRQDDGNVQHVVATTDLTVSSGRLIEMGETTDHPSLLVGLTGSQTVR
jgi:endonuclease/exonuclease/phosphatase family metal-dependent hydrolase